MVDFSAFNVTKKIVANNSPKTPTEHNSEVVEKKDYNMAHPQRMEEPKLADILNTLDFSNLDKNTNGLILNGNPREGGFMLTPGVLKFPCEPSSSEPPPYTPPVYDSGTPTTDTSGKPAKDKGGPKPPSSGDTGSQPTQY